MIFFLKYICLNVGPECTGMKNVSNAIWTTVAPPPTHSPGISSQFTATDKPMKMQVLCLMNSGLSWRCVWMSGTLLGRTLLLLMLYVNVQCSYDLLESGGGVESNAAEVGKDRVDLKMTLGNCIVSNILGILLNSQMQWEMVPVWVWYTSEMPGFVQLYWINIGHH